MIFSLQFQQNSLCFQSFFAKIINILRFRKIKYNMAFLFIIYYTFIELFFEFCHIFINFASKTIIKSYPLK